jgi:hypothetical protein
MKKESVKERYYRILRKVFTAESGRRYDQDLARDKLSYRERLEDISVFPEAAVEFGRKPHTWG